MPSRSFVSALLVALLFAACSAPDGAPNADAGAADANPIFTERPYEVTVPEGYDAAEPTPLVLVLHGYSATGLAQSAYFGLLDAADRHGFLLAYPDGTLNSQRKQYWNATDGCCDLDDSNVDDVAYLTAVLDDLEAHFNVDPKRIFVIGHSNGGFMAHRLACDIGGRLAAIASLAGMTWKDPARCPAAARVNVLQIHGDQDDAILFAGTDLYPSATTTVATWATKNGCTGTLTDGAARDLDAGVPGAETATASYGNCQAGGAVDLWTMKGASHIPSLESHGLVGRRLDLLRRPRQAVGAEVYRAAAVS